MNARRKRKERRGRKTRRKERRKTRRKERAIWPLEENWPKSKVLQRKTGFQEVPDSVLLPFSVASVVYLSPVTHQECFSTEDHKLGTSRTFSLLSCLYLQISLLTGGGWARYL